MSKKAPRQSRPDYPIPEQDNRVSRFSRRDVLKAAGQAGAGLLLIPSASTGQRTDIVLGGRPVEIVVSSVSPLTVRLSAMPIEGGVPTIALSDGAVGRERDGRLPAAVLPGSSNLSTPATSRCGSPQARRRSISRRARVRRFSA